MGLAKAVFPSLSQVRGQQASALRHGLPYSSNFIHFIRATTSSPKSCCLQADRGGSGRARGTAGRSTAAAILSSRGRESRRPPRRERRGSARPAAVPGAKGRQRGALRALALLRSRDAYGGVPARPACPTGANGPGRSRSGVPAAGALREERARCRRFLLRGGRKAARPGSGRGPGLGGSAAVAGQPPSLPQWGRAGRGKGRAPPPRWAME